MAPHKKPIFKRLGNGRLVLKYSEEARRVAEQTKKACVSLRELPGSVVARQAAAGVRKLFGKDSEADSTLVLGYYRLQFCAEA